jgi:hypothetical protein
MPRKCTVCLRADRSDIDQALNAGETLDVIASHFGISRLSAYRHRRNHLAGVVGGGSGAEANVVGGDDARPALPAEPVPVAVSKPEEIAEERLPPVNGGPGRHAVAVVEAGIAADRQAECPQSSFVHTVVPLPVFTISKPKAAVNGEERIMRVDGKPPGPCPTCGSWTWRMRPDNSLVCATCRPMPARA